MLKKEFSFELIAQEDKARLGKIITSRGQYRYTCFYASWNTQGTVKGIFPDDLVKTGTQIILGNTYHLLLDLALKLLKNLKVYIIT